MKKARICLECAKYLPLDSHSRRKYHKHCSKLVRLRDARKHQSKKRWCLRVIKYCLDCNIPLNPNREVTYGRKRCESCARAYRLIKVRGKPRIHSKVREVNCNYCHTGFTTNRSNTRFCSTRCREKYYGKFVNKRNIVWKNMSNEEQEQEALRFALDLIKEVHIE